MKKLIIVLLSAISFFARGQQQIINIGSSPNDHTGDPLRTAFTKVNTNFTQLFSGAANTILGINNAGTAPEFKTVSNGLTSAAGTFKLGGAITGTTLIGPGNFELQFDARHWIFGSATPTGSGATAGFNSFYFGGGPWAGSGVGGTLGGSSFSLGSYIENRGTGSFAGGSGIGTVVGGLDGSIRALGNYSFIWSKNTSAQTSLHGANADNSAILGGIDHNIAAGNDRAAIIGGNAIKLTSGYSDFVAVPSLALFTTPAAGSTNDVLTWDATTKKVGKVTQASLGGGGGTWGSITGTLSNQTDLQAALDGKWSLANGGTLTGANVITGTTTNTLKYRFDNLGTTVTDGAGQWLANTAAAGAGAQQQSPYLTFEGQGWATTPVQTQQTKWIVYNLPVQGAANPGTSLVFASSVNGAAYVNRMILGTTSGTGGTLNSSALVTIAGNATLNIRSQTTGTAGVGVQVHNNGVNFNATSGTQSQLGIGLTSESFAPPSGTAPFNSVVIQQTINQAGGANGQITGVNNNPTIAAAVNVTGFIHDPINPGNISGNDWGFYSKPTAAYNGFGVTPSALVTVGAGTTTIPPLKFTSGTSLTSPVAGVEEFTTDDLFFTITTGTARKRLLMADPVGGLTSGRVLIATTNGRATDDAGLTYSGGILALTSSPTGPTPSALDNSSKLIPSAYVDGATGKLDKLAAFNNQTTSYTLALSDATKDLEINNAGAVNVTIPLNATVAFPVGTQITVWNMGAGQVTIVLTGGVTGRSAGSKYKLTQQNSSCVLKQRAVNDWWIAGDLTL